MRPDIGLADDDESRLFKCSEQFCPGPQFQMFGEVREQQPAFSSRFQMRGQAIEESVQHSTLRIVDRLFDGRGGPCRDPRRVADYELSLALGKEIGLHAPPPGHVSPAEPDFRGRKPGREGLDRSQ